MTDENETYAEPAEVVENSQEQPTPFTQPPAEPGEIGWHANADSPDVDLSLPEPGSGAPASSEPPEATPPTLESPSELDPQPEPVLVTQPETEGAAVVHEPQPGEIGFPADATEPLPVQTEEAEIAAANEALEVEGGGDVPVAEQEQSNA